VPRCVPGLRPDIIDVDAAARRGEDQRRLVADAAGRMLVDLGPVEIGEVERCPESTIARVRWAVSAASMPRRKIAMRRAEGLVVGPVPAA